MANVSSTTLTMTNTSDWLNDKFDGSGSYIFKNGERYEGTSVNGVKCSKGGYLFVNGNKYQGDWTNDRKSWYWIYNYTS